MGFWAWFGVAFAVVLVVDIVWTLLAIRNAPPEEELWPDKRRR